MASKRFGATLADVRHEALIDLLGSRCYGNPALAIDGVNAENVETANSVSYSIDGVMYTKAAVAEIDLSALGVLDEEGTAQSAVTAQEDGKDRAYLLVLNAAGTIFIVEGDDVDTGETVRPPQCPNGYAPYGIVKVENASGADFTFGTTDLSTAGVTDTYVNVSVCPASV